MKCSGFLRSRPERPPGERETPELHDILITHGKVIDGTGSLVALLDVAIDGTRISGLYKHSGGRRRLQSTPREWSSVRDS